MDSNCYQCSAPIKSIDCLQCSGFCNQAVHLNCAGVKRPNMNFINEHKNALWFCDNCYDQLQNIKENPLNSTVNVTSAISEAINGPIAELKCEIQEIKELTKTLAGNKLPTDPPALPRSRPWPSVKRPREPATRGTPKSRPDAKLVGGTKSVEKNEKTVETVAKPAEKFWLYLSRIARTVTEDDISELVKNCLQIDEDVEVRKLVRKDADLNQLAFISFKVGINKGLREIALDPSVWPKGIFFREFEHLSSARDFWGPIKVPRTDRSTPAVETFETPVH